jgi:hypothetical protein
MNETSQSKRQPTWEEQWWSAPIGYAGTATPPLHNPLAVIRPPHAGILDRFAAAIRRMTGRV